MDERLVGLGLLGSEPPESRQQSRRNANGDELLGVARLRAADAPRPPQLFIRGFRNVAEINAAIRRRLCAPSGSPAVQ